MEQNGFVGKTQQIELQGFTLSLNDVKFPWVGGLHDMTAVFPLRTDTDKFDGGSGAAIKIISFENLCFINLMTPSTVYYGTRTFQHTAFEINFLSSTLIIYNILAQPLSRLSSPAIYILPYQNAKI